MFGSIGKIERSVQVVRSSIKAKFEMCAGHPGLVGLRELNFHDNKGGKPARINQRIGRRPIAAFYPFGPE